MRNNERQAFDNLLDKLQRHFPEKEITPELRRDYWDALAKYDLALISQYVTRYLDSGTFFPKISQLQPKSRGAADPGADEQNRQQQELADRAAAASWDESLRRDPQEAALKIKLAKLSRMELLLPIGDINRPALHRAVQDAQKQLLVLWERRRLQNKTKLFHVEQTA